MFFVRMDHLKDLRTKLREGAGGWRFGLFIGCCISAGFEESSVLYQIMVNGLNKRVDTVEKSSF